MKVLIVTGLTLPEVSEADVARVREAAGPGAEVVVVGRIRDAVAVAGDVEVILGVVPPPLLDAAPALRWVHATASGVDAFLYPAFRDRGIVLTGEKGLVGGHLADHAFGLLLAITRRIAAAVRLGPDAWQHREQLRREELELEGLVMGVVGFGGTGRAVTRRAVAFGMECLAVDAVDDVVAEPGDGVAEVWPTARLHDLLARSDIVTICCPLTESTRDLFDHAAFAAMKPGAIVVNVTRGEVVDGDALVAALASGHLAGAGLDVAPAEPLPPDHPLWGFDTVVMTPHTAGASQHRSRRNLERFCDNLRRDRHGEALVGVVDQHAGF